MKFERSVQSKTTTSKDWCYF